MKDFFNKLVHRPHKLTFGQELSILFVVLSIVLIPAAVNLALKPIDLRNFASSPATPPDEITPSPSGGPSITDWRTDHAAFLANNFYIDVGGRFYGDEKSLDLSSSPPYFSSDNQYHTTLEARWTENGVEMRMFMYFRSPDLFNWTMYELWTYDGRADGDWIKYYPRDPITGTVHDPYNVGVLNLYGVSDYNGIQGNVHFENLLLNAFWNSQTPTPTVTTCKEGINTTNINVRCKGNVTYKKITYTCHDGYRFALSSSVCKAQSYFDEVAEEKCAGHTRCSNESSCNTLKVYSFRQNCGGDNYRFINYTCNDGYKGTLGSKTVCFPDDYWKGRALDQCRFRPFCSQSPTPTPSL